MRVYCAQRSIVQDFKYGFPQFPQAAKERKKKQKKKEMAATTIYPIPPFTPEGEYYKGNSFDEMSCSGVLRPSMSTIPSSSLGVPHCAMRTSIANSE
jgi:hypothetical protein